MIDDYPEVFIPMFIILSGVMMVIIGILYHWGYIFNTTNKNIIILPLVIDESLKTYNNLSNPEHVKYYNPNDLSLNGGRPLNESGFTPLDISCEAGNGTKCITMNEI